MLNQSSKRLRLRGYEAALLEKLRDERGRRVVFLSHCLLDENVRYLGGAFRFPSSSISTFGAVSVWAGQALLTALFLLAFTSAQNEAAKRVTG